MENTTHQRLTVGTALEARLARFAYKTRAKDLLKRCARLGAFLAVTAAIVAPHAVLGYLAAVITVKSVAVTVWIVAFLYGRAIMRWCRRRSLGGNQHTYEGIEIDALASFIIENKHFRREESMRHFGMSKKKYERIARKLDDVELLVRGPNNSRVLQEAVTREILVRQLRDGFKMRWNAAGGQWTDADSRFESYLHARDRDERRAQEKVERLQKQKQRLQRDVDEQEAMLNPLFTRRALTLQ